MNKNIQSYGVTEKRPICLRVYLRQIMTNFVTIWLRFGATKYVINSSTAGCLYGPISITLEIMDRPKSMVGLQVQMQ